MENTFEARPYAVTDMHGVPAMFADRAYADLQRWSLGDSDLQHYPDVSNGIGVEGLLVRSIRGCITE